jgi:SAM-dependent methyltransferase
VGFPGSQGGAVVNDTPVYWPSFLRELDSTERAWNNRTLRYPRGDAVPWLPFPRSQFIALLADAVEAAPLRVGKIAGGGSFVAPRFLDVGAGTGTKIRLAHALFGVEGYGIEIVPELVAEARAHGVKVDLADAFGWEAYDQADIVYLNRPSTLMKQMEATVMDGMASGSVLMMVNGRCDPGTQGWTLVSREWGEPTHGCWIKP